MTGSHTAATFADGSKLNIIDSVQPGQVHEKSSRMALLR